MAPTATPTRPRADLVAGITPAELTDTAPRWFLGRDNKAHRSAHPDAPMPTPPCPALAGIQATRCGRTASTYPASDTAPRCTDC